MNYREKRDVFNFKIFKNIEVTGKFNSPVIKPIQVIPKNITSFNYFNSIKNPQDYFVHFYIDDYQFERVWNFPNTYTKALKRFAGVIGPDFSAYTDMSISQRIWNIYRNKLLTAYWQKNGIDVIPNIRWIDNCGIEELNNGFDGYSKFSTVAITTNGIKSTNEITYFTAFCNMLEKLKPKQIVVIGKLPEEYKNLCNELSIPVYEYISNIQILENKRKEKRYAKSKI